MMKHLYLIGSIVLLNILMPFTLAAKSVLFDQQLNLLSGDAISLDTLRAGKPVYLKFWASWCKPCIQEMPHLQHSYAEYSDKIQVVAVNIDINETRQDINKVIDRFSLTAPIALDSDGMLAKAYNFIGTPYHILINKQGEVVHKSYKADETLDRRMRILAKENINDLPQVSLLDGEGNKTSFDDGFRDNTVLLFTATWCDWYLADTRPQMSEACIQGQKNVSQIYALSPELPIQGIVSHLWTGSKELKEYTEKYAVGYPVGIDETGDMFFAFGVKQFPTMIIMKDGVEVYRTNDVANSEIVSKVISRYFD
jgi:thiol-disulfide isomerase/thioredoxin